MIKEIEVFRNVELFNQTPIFPHLLICFLYFVVSNYAKNALGMLNDLFLDKFMSRTCLGSLNL